MPADEADVLIYLLMTSGPMIDWQTLQRGSGLMSAEIGSSSPVTLRHDKIYSKWMDR